MVFYDTTEKKLKVDSTKSSSGRSSGSVESAPLELGSTEGLKLRIFVDKSIVEISQTQDKQLPGIFFQKMKIVQA